MGTHYFDSDLLYLIRRGSVMRLAKPRSAMVWLRAQVEAGHDCADALRDYPSLRIEALEFHYACLLSLGALDEHLIRDLASKELGWQGVVWGAFLVALEPREAFAPPLRAVADAVPHNRWLVSFALDRIAGRASQGELAPFARSVHGLRASLELAARPQVSLRVTPLAGEAETIAREREAVTAAYRRRGLVAAQTALVGTRLATYLLSYPEWVHSLAGELRA